MKEEKNLKNKDSILDYFISLFEDVQDFSWDTARASHAVLLCRMEQGEVQNYTDTEKINRIRHANAQRHLAPSTSTVNLKKQSQKTNKSLTCIYYNQGTCSFARTHDTNGSYISIFVQRVLQWLERITLTQKVNVEVKLRKLQKKKQLSQGMGRLKHTLYIQSRIFYNNF